MTRITYHIIEGYGQLQNACCGTERHGGQDAWLLWPELRYWAPGGFLGHEDGYTYLVGSTPRYSPDHGRMLEEPVGLIELQRSPFRGERHTVWLKYITVDPRCQRQGIASRLIKMLAEYMAKGDDLLSRSYSSEEGMRIRARVDKALDDAGVPWTQSQREAVGKANATRQALAA